ncbi:MAG: EamA family transporter [Hyphomicrobiales bacterium]|nr:MAG: EamA family transporter [Hyphomicrobiales bacterium]
MSRITANFLLLLAGFVWGLGFVAQDTAMLYIGPFQFVGFRFALATLVVAPFAFLEARKLKVRGKFVPFSRIQKLSLFGVGVVFFSMMILQQIGLLATSVTNAGMLTGLYVIFVPLIALAVLKERQTIIVWPASLLALGGIWLLGGGGIDQFSWGDGLVVAGAIFAAIQVIMIGRLSSWLHRPVAVATIQFAVCAVLSFIGFGAVQIGGWGLEPAFHLPDLVNALPEIIFAACFAGGLAFTLQAIAQRHTPAADAAVLLSSEALFAAIAGAILLGERLDWLGYLGCTLMLLAIILVAAASARFELQNPQEK